MSANKLFSSSLAIGLVLLFLPVPKAMAGYYVEQPVFIYESSCNVYKRPCYRKAKVHRPKRVHHRRRSCYRAVPAVVDIGYYQPRCTDCSYYQCGSIPCNNAPPCGARYAEPTQLRYTYNCSPDMDISYDRATGDDVYEEF